ncbi:uncharacterized protein LOC112165790 [Rosa chinensis]|uniref:uncharacterized protein LOC112186753 n=1 Tax=Rosa chinensis TaxID=74649 RepID=UPI000D090604|nr:uncharacterized protein LOC112186753 [Rosa chinensis]XP_024181027.1 uncharacterized protein LOC112186753 [Rosa chinensis]XP_040369405.1 uncharacterized protein LOC112186753 [Rosa chinensis]XP_040375424.1 uncharacterized protein LOC112165790 [Rosa chinensis]XP_040375425.1 uncharacterized protein LOC112165790 [Rosa chinensis]XP_040375426.1 uncharacterized protein LOC112165790 [Rosa chinensis]
MLNANLLWPGTFAFAEWLIQNRPLIEGQHCIELGRWPLCSQIQSSGVDNSGKTRIVLTINGEDTSLVTPTLGFNINTLTYQNSNFNGETRGIRKC